ncbi:MAG: hypothetical protein HY851_12110, partial [candidate division Zixibacteria bacterium]|nr:hypothetical protein [candidate division Zixibacteria bacterium]
MKKVDWDPLQKAIEEELNEELFELEVVVTADRWLSGGDYEISLRVAYYHHENRDSTVWSGPPWATAKDAFDLKLRYLPQAIGTVKYVGEGDSFPIHDNVTLGLTNRGYACLPATSPCIASGVSGAILGSQDETHVGLGIVIMELGIDRFLRGVFPDGLWTVKDTTNNDPTPGHWYDIVWHQFLQTQNLLIFPVEIRVNGIPYNIQGEGHVEEDFGLHRDIETIVAERAPYPTDDALVIVDWRIFMSRIYANLSYIGEGYQSKMNQEFAYKIGQLKEGESDRMIESANLRFFWGQSSILLDGTFDFGDCWKANGTIYCRYIECPYIPWSVCDPVWAQVNVFQSMPTALISIDELDFESRSCNLCYTVWDWFSDPPMQDEVDKVMKKLDFGLAGGQDSNRPVGAR